MFAGCRVTRACCLFAGRNDFGKTSYLPRCQVVEPVLPKFELFVMSHLLLLDGHSLLADVELLLYYIGTKSHR